MELDRKIEWAEKISKELHSVRRNEFRTWVEYFQQNDLNSALGYARRLSQSRMLRKQQKKAFGKIFHGIKKYRNDLSLMSEETVAEIFGYVMWGLHIWAEKKITFARGHPETFDGKRMNVEPYYRNVSNSDEQKSKRKRKR